MNKKLLVVVDMQNDFISGSLGTMEAVNIVDNVIKRCEQAIEAGEDIIFTQDTHFTNYLDTPEGKKLPVAHCIYETQGWEIHEKLNPYAKSILTKHTFGCEELPQICGKYDTITLVGLCTDICVVSNALLIKTYFPDKEIAVEATCCAGVTPETHEAALTVMQMCQIDIIRDNR